MARIRREFVSLLLVSLTAAGNAQSIAEHHDLIGSLPDAPSWLLATQANAAIQYGGTGRISGVVLDINGGIVPGATITLVEAGNSAQASPGAGIVSISDAAGRFMFDKLAPGRYKFTITAEGLQSFVSNEMVLKPGELREASEISLPIVSAKFDVQVTVTQYQIAEEQIRAEEKQRVFGVLPNFYTSYIWNAAPLRKSQKTHLALRSATDPIEFLGASVQAAAQYEAGTFAGYGYGLAGYSKRFAAAYGDGAIARMIGSGVLPSILHQDPRYFYKGSGTKKSRVFYAIGRAVVTRSDEGRSVPNYSHIGGAFIGGAISNAYHPHADRGFGLTITNGLIDTAGNAVNNLIREFILRDLTPNVPSYAKGKPLAQQRSW